jgi:hypothetical protein
LELLQGFLVLSALKERHAVGIAAIGDEVGTAAGHRQASADQHRCQAKRTAFAHQFPAPQPDTIAAVGTEVAPNRNNPLAK